MPHTKLYIQFCIYELLSESGEWFLYYSIESETEKEQMTNKDINMSKRGTIVLNSLSSSYVYVLNKIPNISQPPWDSRKGGFSCQN